MTNSNNVIFGGKRKRKEVKGSIFLIEIKDLKKLNE
jgi:hypothetical protein